MSDEFRHVAANLRRALRRVGYTWRDMQGRGVQPTVLALAFREPERRTLRTINLITSVLGVPYWTVLAPRCYVCGVCGALWSSECECRMCPVCGSSEIGDYFEGTKASEGKAVCKK